MLFTSYEFLGFLMLLLILYYIIPAKYQWILLLVASGAFYYIASPVYLLYIFTTIATVYFTACQMEKHSDKLISRMEISREEKKVLKKQQKTIRKRWMIGCLLINIGILVAVKYLNFFIENINAVL